MSLPTNIEYQRLLMTQRVLFDKGQEPTQQLYELLKSVFAAKEELGLAFKEGFTVKLPLDKKVQGDIDNLPAETRREVVQKAGIVFQVVSERLREIHAEAGNPPKSLAKSDAEKNIAMLTQALQFNETQQELLMFYACAAKGRYNSILQAALPDKVASQEDYVDGLAVLLGKKDKKSLEKELNPENILLGVNFLGHDPSSQNYFIDRPLQRILERRYETVDELMVGVLGPNPQTELTVKDYGYMKDDLQQMARTLKGYIEDPSTKAVKNMTIGGPPGTGKTQVTAILAKALKVPAFLVGVARKSEATGFSLDEPTRDDRIKALVRSAFILRQTGKKALLVFDEAEDVLRDLNRDGSKDTGSKAFINELLEHLGVPVIFISNRTDLFDPATTRRILPYYGMNYMPFEARIGTIIAKTKQYIGTDLTREDVKRLSNLASELSVAVIDTCINAAGQRKPDKTNKELVLREIESDFRHALKAQNGGIPPVPLREPFDEKGFVPTLVSANEDVAALRKSVADKPDRWAGKEVVVIGKAGTGRTSVAQHLALATGKEPRVVALNSDALARFPNHAHADDMERSALDGIPLVFEGSTQFLANSNGHPLLERVRAHPLPTVFVGDMPSSDKISTQEFEEALSHLTFVVRTGSLSRAQLHEACEKLLGVKMEPQDLRGLQDITIGAIVTVKKQMETLGLEGDKAEALKRLEAIAQRTQESSQDRGKMGFAALIDQSETGRASAKK